METDNDIRSAVIELLSETKDQQFTNQEIFEKLTKRGVEFRYTTHHMDILSGLARRDLIQRVLQGVYTIPSSGHIRNTFQTRRKTAAKRSDDHPAPVEGDIFVVIATSPLLVKSSSGQVFRLTEVR